MGEQNNKYAKLEEIAVQFSRNELLELHKRVLERVRKMTPQEGVESFIKSGIYTPEGKLAKEYGG